MHSGWKQGLARNSRRQASSGACASTWQRALDRRGLKVSWLIGLRRDGSQYQVGRRSGDALRAHPPNRRRCAGAHKAAGSSRSCRIRAFTQREMVRPPKGNRGWRLTEAAWGYADPPRQWGFVLWQGRTSRRRGRGHNHARNGVAYEGSRHALWVEKSIARVLVTGCRLDVKPAGTSIVR